MEINVRTKKELDQQIKASKELSNEDKIKLITALKDESEVLLGYVTRNSDAINKILSR